MVSLSDLADALRWGWLAVGMGWLTYAWLHRVSYRKALGGVALLVVLDLLAHAGAAFAERPNSGLPSDFPLYTIVMVAAAGAGLASAALYAHRRDWSVGPVLEAALVTIVAGGIGGRAYQVWMHLDYYAENRDTVADVTQGGLGLAGALVAGLVALWLYARIRGRAFWALADAAAVGLALAQSIGWYGAALTHTHYGLALEAKLPDAGAFEPLAGAMRALAYAVAQDLPDAYNLIALRAPVQLVASGLFAALWLALLVAGWRKGPGRAGFVFLVYWIAAGAVGFLLGFWRGDETRMWNGLRMEQWFGLAMILSGAALAVVSNWTPRRRPRSARAGKGASAL